MPANKVLQKIELMKSLSTRVIRLCHSDHVVMKSTSRSLTRSIVPIKSVLGS